LPQGLSSPLAGLTAEFERGEKWDGTHFARLIEVFVSVFAKQKSNEWTVPVRKR